MSVLRAIEEYLKADREELVLLGFAMLNSTDVDIKYKLLVLNRAGFSKKGKADCVYLTKVTKVYSYFNEEFSDCSNYTFPLGLYQQFQMKNNATYNMFLPGDIIYVDNSEGRFTFTIPTPNDK